MFKIFYIEKKQLGGGISKPSGTALSVPVVYTVWILVKLDIFF